MKRAWRVDADKWKELEEEFDKYGYSHIFSKSRFMILLKLDEFDWPPNEIVREALQYYRTQNKDFTFKQFIFKMYVLETEKVHEKRRNETERIFQKYRKKNLIQDGGKIE